MKTKLEIFSKHDPLQNGEHAVWGAAAPLSDGALQLGEGRQGPRPSKQMTGASLLLVTSCISRAETWVPGKETPSSLAPEK